MSYGISIRQVIDNSDSILVSTGQGNYPFRDEVIRFDNGKLAFRTRKLSFDGVVIVNGQGTPYVDTEFYHDAHDDQTSLLTSTLTFEGSVRAVGEEPPRVPHTTPGSYGIIYREDPRFRTLLPGSSPYCFFEVNLTSAYARRLIREFPVLRNLYLSVLGENDLCARVSSPGALTPAMKRIAHAIIHSEDYGPARQLFVEAKILELLALQLSAFIGNAGTELAEDLGLDAPYREQSLNSRDTDMMHAARSLLETRITNPPSLKELARAVGTNEFSLKRNFKLLFGKPVYEYLLGRRMDIASELLLNTDFTVELIAGEVGYSSGAHFSSAFRKSSGLSPTEFRRWKG